MISQVFLPGKVITFFIIVAVVSVTVLAVIGFSVRKVSKRMGLANSTSGCLAILVPILLVILVVWGLFHQSQPVEQYQPDDMPQYEQEMQQEIEMQQMKLREN